MQTLSYAHSSSLSRNNKQLVYAFNQLFEVIPATTPILLEKAYRLRYQVYCKENNFERPDTYPEECETDEYDARSAHSLLYDRTSNSFAGTVRIILPLQEAPERSFPIQRVCSHPILTGRKLAVTKTAAEISRFSISKEYRQNTQNPWTTKNLSLERQEEFSNYRRLVTPFITLGLIRAIMQMSVEHGVTHLFAVMEPSLLRLLGRFSIYFKPIGPLVNYHGMRQPCYSNVETLLNRVFKERADVWEVITDEGRLLKGLHSAIHLCG